MKLTEKETAEVEKLLSGFEKRAGASKRHRWVLLAGSLFLLGSGVFALCMLHYVFRLQSTHKGLWTIEGQITGLQIETYVRMQLLFTWLHIVLYGLGLFQIVMGISLSIKTATDWNKGTRDLLIAKILRGKWEDEKVNYDATIQRDN